MTFVPSSLVWRDSKTPSPGVGQRDFIFGCEGRSVPGVVWLPADVPLPRPAVLLGHGGGSNKHSARNQRLAELLTAAGLIAVAIDGPYHGERVKAPMPPAAYQQLIIDEGVSAVTERMTADWLATLVVLRRAQLVSEDPVGYIGMSMGGRYGLPLAAARRSRLGAVVIGKFGLQQTPLDRRPTTPGRRHRAIRTNNRWPHADTREWDDEVFPRDGQIALFDVLGAPDKRLLAYPGLHSETPPQAERDWTEFVTTCLSGPGQRMNRPSDS